MGIGSGSVQRGGKAFQARGGASAKGGIGASFRAWRQHSEGIWDRHRQVMGSEAGEAAQGSQCRDPDASNIRQDIWAFSDGPWGHWRCLTKLGDVVESRAWTAGEVHPACYYELLDLGQML